MKLFTILLLTISFSLCAQNDTPKFTLSSKSDEWNKYFFDGIANLTSAITIAESHSNKSIASTLNDYRLKFISNPSNISIKGWILYENILEITCECDLQIASSIENQILNMAENFEKAEQNN